MSFFNKILELLGLNKPKTKIARKNQQNQVVEPPAPIESVAAEPPPQPRPVKPKDVPWMYPNNWKYVVDPDGGKKELQTKDGKPIGVVIHHTATYNLNGTVSYFTKNAVDVHFVMGHDGKIVQMVPCNRTAAHAGESEWNGKKWLNNYYVGIEVVNIGWLTKKGDKFYDGYKREWKGKVRERKAEGQQYWEPFTDAQEKALFDLCVWLVKTYDIPVENIAAHFEVSPGRKNDPAGGLSMSFDQFRKMVGDRVSQT